MAGKRGITKKTNQRKLKIVESSVGALSKVSIKDYSCCTNLETESRSRWFINRNKL
jgi:hypothetical protein